MKLSDTFADDPRLERAGVEALAMHIAGLCFSARQLTNGAIPARTALRLWSIDDPVAAIEALVDVGLWEKSADGYVIVGYLDDQPSADKVREQQRMKAERQKRWLDGRRGASRDASQDGSKDPAPPRPEGSGVGAAAVPAAAAPLADGDLLYLRPPCQHDAPGGRELTSAGTFKCPSCRREAGQSATS